MELATVDTTSEAFGARLAAILRAARHDQERSLRSMARSSRGSFRSRTLKDLETGQADLRDLDLAALASLYQIDLAALLQKRVPLVVDVSAGTLSTAGVARSFDPGHPDGLLLAYLYLVRDLRDLKEARSIALRREDVEVLASGLCANAAAVLDRLGELMGSTVTQRRSAIAMFAAGAAVIVLSTGAVALDSGLYQPTDGGDGDPGAAAVALATADDLGDRGDLGGVDDLAGGPLSDVETLVSPSGAPATAAGLATPAPGLSTATPVVDASPATPGAPQATPRGPSGADGGAPSVDGPVADGPVVETPDAATPPTEPSPPGVPGQIGAAPQAPVPGGPTPEGVPPLDEPSDGPLLVDEPSVAVPPAAAPLGDPPPLVDVPPVDVDPESDAPGSDGSSDGNEDVPPEDLPIDVDPDVDVVTPPANQGGTPGNSPAVGNTPNVGTPGNSGNENAGGPSVGGPPDHVPVRGTQGQRPR